MIKFTKNKSAEGFGVLVMLLAFAVLAVLVGGGWYIQHYYGFGDPGYACTQEAKLCPDGSSVGREGPKCEFMACPGTSDKGQGISDKIDTSVWKTYRNDNVGFSILVPKDWYIPTMGDSKTGPVEFTSFPQSAYAEGGIPPAGGEIVSIAKGICNSPTNDFRQEDYAPPSAAVKTHSFQKTVCQNGFQISLEFNDPSLHDVGNDGLRENVRNTSKQELETIAASFAVLTDTSTWKTYRNEKYGFEMKYPPDWNFNGGGSGIAINSPNRAGEDGYPDFWISIFPAASLDDWFSFYFRLRVPGLMPKRESGVFAGLPALLISDPVSEGGCTEFIAVFKGGYVYRITNPRCAGNSIVQSITNSFKFLN